MTDENGINRRRSKRLTTKQEYHHNFSSSPSSDDSDNESRIHQGTPTSSRRSSRVKRTSLMNSFGKYATEPKSPILYSPSTRSAAKRKLPASSGSSNKENKELNKNKLTAKASKYKDKLHGDSNDSGSDSEREVQQISPPKRIKKEIESGPSMILRQSTSSQSRNDLMDTTPLSRNANTSKSRRSANRTLNYTKFFDADSDEDIAYVDSDYNDSDRKNHISSDEDVISGSESESSATDDEEEDPDFGSSAKQMTKTSALNEKLVMIIKRQTALPASPGSHSFSASFTETYNPESYLLANNRLRFKAVKTPTEATNDSRKGRGRPRKGKRGLGGRINDDNLPERVKSNFSVTKETTRAAETCLDVPSSKHDKEIRTHLESQIIPDFPRWMSFMWEGFNIILHGFGSKLPVVDSFCEYLQGNFLVDRINGLCPKLNAKKVIADFVEMLELDIQINRPYSDLVLEDIHKQLPVHPPVFVIVQNLDALALRKMNLINVICSLAKIPWVHLLATTDSVNASLGITQSQCVQLNFCWIPCSTFQSYVEEFMWTPNIFGESTSSKATENTLQYVLKSLTGNARKAFSILASLQLDKLQNLSKKKGKDYIGVEFAKLARKCKDQFVAHSDSVLRTLLVEFVDHKLVTNHQGKRTGNLLTIDLDIGVLQRIVNVGM